MTPHDPDTPAPATPLPLLVGGTIAIDHVKTPAAEAADLLGGSAAYAALAASYFARPVHLLGIVGHDYPERHLRMLERHGVTLDAVERSPGASFSWSGEYLDNLNQRVTRRVAVNVLEDWQVKVPPHLTSTPVVVLANMSPDNQLAMLAQCAAAGRFVVADTMDLWIGIANQRLHEVLRLVDLFVINEGEARDLTGSPNLVLAGERLLAKGPRHVVVKLGEFGAMLFSRPDTGPPQPLTLDGNNFFRCAAFPLREVVDPTGAGDTFLGATAGYLASLGRNSFVFNDIRNAITRGAVLASFTCEAFSTRRLEDLPADEVRARLELFRKMSSW